MKNFCRAVYSIFLSFIIGILHLPFVFAKSAAGSKVTAQPASTTPADTSLFQKPVKSNYDSLQLRIKDLSDEAFQYALKGFDYLVQKGLVQNDSIITIIDFSLPSHQKRLFIIDTRNYKILVNTLVAHGKNSGREIATNFSNSHSSHMSSPGFFITRETYTGKNGYSLKLEGLEKGINDNSYNRGIVVHGAAYVNEALAKQQGYIGRSQGCPAVPEETTPHIINLIKNGTCLFIYHPSYIKHSVIL